MIRNLKALGLAMVAAFALSAVGATAAQALTADVGAGGNTITAKQAGTGEHTEHSFVLSSKRTLKCNGALFEGSIVNGAKEIKVTPIYSGCFSNGSQPTTVTHNGCKYRFYGGNEVTANHFDNIEVDLEGCSKELEVHVYSSEANHTSGTVLCTYKVHAFTGKTGNTAENKAPNVDLTSTVTDIKVTRVTGSALSCGAEEQTAVYTGQTSVKAYSAAPHGEATQVNVSITK
jgi:hypothetical protein